MTLILVAAGQTIVVLRGGIDLSVGGTLSLATAIAATRAETATSRSCCRGWWSSSLIGVLHRRRQRRHLSGLQLQPFVVTLATWSIVERLALRDPADQPVERAACLVRGRQRDVLDLVPVPFLLLLVLLAWWTWFRRTRGCVPHPGGRLRASAAHS